MATRIAEVTLVFGASLFAVKLGHHLLMRWEGVRRAHYIAAVGEIMTRGLDPGSDGGTWVRDPAFREVVLEYHRIVSGEERAHLETLVDRISLRSLLLAEARSRRRGRRLRAVQYLADLARPEMAPLFRQLLQDPVAEVRLHAARGLANLGDIEAVPDLLDRLGDESPWVAARLADILVGFGTDAVPHLVRHLMLTPFDLSGNPSATELVIRVLGLIGDMRAAPVLREMLHSPEPLVRLAAASALGHAGTIDSVRDLITALRHDQDWRVRARAAAALGNLSDPRATAPLRLALTDAVWWVRQNAAEALVSVPGGREALVDALAGPDAYARDAALHQLGMSGAIRNAERRIEEGGAAQADLALVAAVRSADAGNPP